MINLIFLLLLSTTSTFAQVEVKWSESEHLALGEKGALLACSELKISTKNCPIKRIERLDKKLSFRYGELVTAGDFYDHPMDLDQDTKTGIGLVIRCAHLATNTLTDLIPKPPETSDCTFTGLFTIPGYLEILTRNYSHFGWNNMTAYVANHELALKKAQEAYLKKSMPEESRRLLHQALIYNGFADHYLTDAFASGHIRVPRIQIKKWAMQHLRGPLPTYRGDLLSLVLHDHESRNLQTGAEEGLRVKNALGDIWMTLGDGELNREMDTTNLAFVMPEQALKESFKEVLQTWQSGEIPEGIFSATNYVPFNNDVSLVTKFSPEYQKMAKRKLIRLLYGSVPFLEGFWFQKSDLEKMLAALPEIYMKFQFDISQDIQNISNLQKRLPATYLEEFKKVN